MKRALKSIAMKLSDSDIQELINFRKMGDKRVVALRKKRDKLAADLAKLDKRLADLDGAEAKPAAEKPKRGVRRTGKSGGKRVNLSAVIRDIFAQAGASLKASQVVDALPGAGVKVSNVPEMRKRISVVLASQKKHFEQVERGVYRLKD